MHLSMLHVSAGKQAPQETKLRAFDLPSRGVFISNKSEATLSVVRGLSSLARVVKTMASKSPPEARKMASTSKNVINTLSGIFARYQMIGLEINERIARASTKRRYIQLEELVTGRTVSSTKL